MPVYCITGANRGIGLALVRQLAARPDNTILALTRSLSNDLSDLQTVAASVPASTTVHVAECDTGSPDSIRAFAQSAGATLAGHKIDVLINNAGISVSPQHTVADFDIDQMQEMYRINTIGPAVVVRELVRAKLLADDVRVVNVSSGLGSIARKATTPDSHLLGYSMSKAALNMLTAHEAADLRRVAGLKGAVVVSMDPGWVQTDMGGSGANLTTEQSSGGIVKVVDGLKTEDNGCFFEYTGTKLPW